MGRLMMKYFDDMTLGFKLTVAFLAVILVPMAILSYASYKVINSRLMKDARDKAGMGLKAAWTEYYARGEQMRYGMLQAAAMEDIKAAVARRDKAYLKKMMSTWKRMRPYVDVWCVVDGDGVVIARLNGDYSGDALALNGLVSDALKSAEPKISTEILGRELLWLEGNELMERVSPHPAGHDSAGLTQDVRQPPDEALALMVVTPVLSESNRPVGAIVAGDVLNNDSHLPEAVAQRFQDFFATVSLKGARVSTSLVDRSGVSLRWTAVPAEALAGVSSGGPFFLEWGSPGMSYISIFEAIRDNRGNVIGTLDASIPREGLWVIQKENQRLIVVITAVGLAIAFISAVISKARITGPIMSLSGKVASFAAGDRLARASVAPPFDTGDEVKRLAVTFNSMMDEVARREEDGRRHVEQIEVKNRELAVLNEELKKTNEELEVAYEETQSQTEELHAINEELRLLNEDLDRKNAELKKANRIITMEEQELKKAKDKLRLIYDSVTEYIVLVDHDYGVMEANRHFTERFKVSEPAAVGRNIYGFFGIAPPQDCPIKAAIKTGRPADAELIAADGSILRWRAFPLLSTEAEPSMAVVYIRDVTEHRNLQGRLMQSEKLSSLGELVSGVAHEINNPLTGIMCFSELMLEQGGLDEDASSKIRKINEASHRCKKIIDNLLTFARWKRPEKRYESVNRVIENCVDIRAYQLKVENIEVETDLEESLPYTMIDDNQMLQVFLNLANNARDAIVDTGRPGRIRITSRKNGDRIVVRFEDTGKGIPQDAAGKIFDPFFTTKDVGKGTGLGLSISYGIIREHGGNIYFSSVPSGGTEFFVELPIVSGVGKSGAAASTGPRANSLKSMARGLKSLVLDDEPLVRDLLNESLSFSGFTVDMCSSADEALEKIGENDYDLIISDIKMPGMDGKAFYGHVKRIKPHAAGRIVFISGDSSNPETQKFLRQTGNMYIRKPFTVGQLNDIIAKIVF